LVGRERNARVRIVALRLADAADGDDDVTFVRGFEPVEQIDIRNLLNSSASLSTPRPPPPADAVICWWKYPRPPPAA
jgi:hypothetical protein